MTSISPDNRGLTLADPGGYINPARHVRAFGVRMGLGNDGNDTIKRWPRRPPQAAFVPLLASRHPRDGPHPRALCGCRDRRLSDDELDQLERLIEVPDPDLYAALTGDKPLPPNMPARCSTASRRFAPWTTTHEAAGQIACHAARARPRADLCQCRRGCRRSRRLRSGARGRGPAEAAGSQPRVVCRDGPRMQQLARALEFFAPDLPVCSFRPGTASPMTGSRRMAASWRSA